VSREGRKSDLSKFPHRKYVRKKLPISVYKTDGVVLSIIEMVTCVHPLGSFVFKSKNRYEKINLGMLNCPFGGVRISVIGSFRRKAAFKVLAHKKSSMHHLCQSAFEFGGLR